MKKVYLFILSVFALLSCSDDCDHGFSKDANISDILVGSWYEETFNEEDTYSASGTFTANVCNVQQALTATGRYWIDSEKNRLTWSYTSGQKRVEDWKLTNVTDLQFTMSSDLMIYTYGKIVATYTMEVGEAQKILFADANSYNILGYESKSPRIASVTSDGIITAEGEKGTAYIKVKLDDFSVWVKVIVGESTHHLWYDYSSLIGQQYRNMLDALGTPTQSHYEADGDYDTYYYRTDNHEVLVGVSIYIEDNKITQIQMTLKEGLPHSLITAYMDSRYYLYEDFKNGNSDMVYYTSESTLDNSSTLIAYKPGTVGEIIFSDAALYKASILWPDFITFYGLSKEQVKINMEKRGYTFYQSKENYSVDGSDAYLIDGYNMVSAVEFVFNPENVVSQYWIYLTENDQAQFDYLYDNYRFAENEFVKGSGIFTFYDKDKRIKVELDMNKKAVVYTDQTKKQHLSPIVDELFTDYTTFINKTRLSMAEMMNGREPTRQYNNQCDYVISNNQFITRAAFMFTNKGEVKNGIQGVIVDVKEGANQNEIVKYLGSIYVLTSSSDNEIIFYSKDNQVKISYVINEGNIYYTPIGLLTDPQVDSYPQPWIDYTKYFGLTHDEIISTMGEPFADEETRMTYVIVNDYIRAGYFYFDETSRKMWAMYIVGRDDVDLQQYIDILSKRYTFVETGTNTNGDYYRWRNSEDENNATILITFYPQTKRIAFQSL